MINLKHYFGVWKLRLASVGKDLEKIKSLPKEAQFIQALIVRNKCLDIIQELQEAFEPILADFVREQDERFQSRIEEIQFATSYKSSWPFDLGLPSLIAKKKETLKKDVGLWAMQAADFEASFAHKLAGFEREAHVIIGQLTVVYGVSPRHRKKKP
jgi:hypothetical protein